MFVSNGEGHAKAVRDEAHIAPPSDRRALIPLIPFFALIGMLFIAPSADARDPSCHIDPNHPLIGEARWYGLYFEDQKIGHASSSLGFERTAGNEELVQRFSMTFKLEQTEETIVQIRRFDGQPPHELLGGTYRSADRQIDYAKRGHDLHLVEGDIRRTWPDMHRDLCDEEELVMYGFLKGNPVPESLIETADFDVEHQSLIKSSHVLQKVETRQVLGAEHVFHTLETTSSNEVLNYKAKTQFQNGEAVNLFIGPMEFRAESEAIANSPNVGVDLFAEFVKTLNRPLVDLQSIEALTLRATIDDPTLAINDIIESGFNQEVHYESDRSAIVKIAERPVPEETDDLSSFLRPNSSYPADHPRLKALARDILAPIGQDADDQTIARAILEFVSGYIETMPESPYVYHTSSVFDVLDNRTGDCTEHSQLFVTLARAAGLPARGVSGFVYDGDDRAPSLAGHAWVEVLIDGHWVGLDPTWREVDLNRSHVQISNVFVPSLAFEIVDITYR
jgi:hypothetical protein